MSNKFGTRSKERLIGVNHLLQECLDRALSISRQDMTIPGYGGLRSPEDQQKLFLKGVSKLDGYNKKSYHQTGNAADAIPVNGYSNAKGFREFARCMFTVWQKMIQEGKTEGYILEWGGHWRNFIDVPHWQIVKR